MDGVCARLHEHLPEPDADQAEEFVRQYYRWVPPEDLEGKSGLDLYGAALSHLNFARERTPGQSKVRVFNPQFEIEGWQTTHTALQIVTDNMPFLIDSVSIELSRHGFGIHSIIHPVIAVRRDANGHLAAILPNSAEIPDDAIRESVVHVEVDRQTASEDLDTLHGHVLRVLGEVRSAVEDWRAMRAQALDIAANLESSPPAGIDPGDVAEAKAFFEWLEAHNFTFLGYREYNVVDRGGDIQLAAIEGTGLGILRGGGQSSDGFEKLPPPVRALALEPYLLNLTKANSRATVHRPSYLDYVGIKRFDADGKVIGERRFLGLYSHTAYHASPREIPILRRKYDDVLARAAFPRDSHNEKALIEILESYPRDELFQVSQDDLFETAMGILHLGERQRLRLFVRADRFGRFLSCLIFIPRDRFNTDNRRRIESILRDAFDATSVDYTTRVSESVLVRLHYMVYCEPRLRDFDVADLEQRIVTATRSWVDDVEEALVEEEGEERGNALRRIYGDAFPPAYRSDWVARSALVDIRRIEELEPGGIAMSLYRPLEAPEGVLRAKLYRADAPLTLSSMLPLFENMGVQVADERPYEIRRHEGSPVWIYDFGLMHEGDEDRLGTDRVRDEFQDAFIRAWEGEVENDGYNRLVLRSGLAWRQIAVLRAVAKYLRQAGTTFSDTYVERAMCAHPKIARQIAELFEARFDPARAERDSQRRVEDIERAIDAVESLDQDQILRSFLAVVQSMLRTNYFQPGADGEPKPYLSFKLDPQQLAFLPQPRPQFEIFVYSPLVEGVHLRGGRVARGGLRWSDRREDFRTEVLGLMKAQMVKNAVIVPVGAKGGFVVKRAGEDGIECYRTFIRGLLDVTDNIAPDGALIPPPAVVRYDGDDPYLVVAADKGTATFSDIANGVAAEYDFWLGDAFASGGSAGYDHKVMGITARGAWESVKRHFRELGRDIQTEDFTVVGVGDMSGDVFGNGMLLSEHIRLVAAFNHREIFIDPDPDAASSFAERKRLFDLAGSSWSDYDMTKISDGGGVWPRTAKSIELSLQAREALGIDAAGALAPSDVMRAILRAPVDLLWNGGIGTYVKATTETHLDAGDKANDALRVNADELRCAVIGEGGNLGMTQRARIEYALADGRVNTDAIDNSAGVDCSDHEVNIKILLNQVVADGDLTVKQRNALLEEMTDAVAAAVLQDNYEQTETLSLAEANAKGMLDVHGRLIRWFEQRRNLDRELEALPDDEELAERKREHRGLTRPELAVVLAFSKIQLFAELLESDVPEDPYLSTELEQYFPSPLPERFDAQMASHRLRREIAATRVVNNILHGGGTTFVFRLHEETGASSADIARAYTIAREIFQMRPNWWEIEKLDNRVAADVQIQMLLEGRRVIERAARWLLRKRRRPLDIAATVAYFGPGAAELYETLPQLLAPDDAEPILRRAESFEQAGVPGPLARRVAGLSTMFATLDIVEIAGEADASLADVARAHFQLGSQLYLHWLRDRIVELPRDDRWKALARAALRDDLNGIHRDLTAAVLREAGSVGDAESRVRQWIETNTAGERYMQTLSDVRVGRVYDLTTLPVAVREARNLLH
ncbi:MAG TPA: NAD-glutamate dehydrogenase [Thermoleophilaceae bacterium]|nr:NAD-glutamate dehydrogenase [Thermoleophilaceae bacterium]